MRFSVEFLGCKVSHADAREIAAALRAHGHEQVAPGSGADLAVVNGCCVTAEAVAKSRKAASRAARGAGRVVLSGCPASLPGTPFAGLPRLTVMPGAAAQVAQALAAETGGTACTHADGGSERVRAFVKIQDGCSFGCAFCVIPLV